jgi:hypothetical protein
MASWSTVVCVGAQEQVLVALVWIGVCHAVV